MLGLPWSNAQKITIGTDEHILDTTINRGLVMLLQNDYYLETRGHIFSQEIAELYNNNESLFSTLTEHINNELVHRADVGSTISYSTYQVTNAPQYTINVSNGQELDLKKLIEEDNLNGLIEDTICFLPINQTPAILNDKISSFSRNLNGKTLFFIFTVPTGYNKQHGFEEGFDTLSAEYILDVSNDSIRFEHFYNGTIVIMGDYLHKTVIDGIVNFPEPTEKDSVDNIIKTKFINSIYKELINPEKIDDIIDYETNSQLSKNLKKIKLKGSCLNNEYSVLSLCDVTAKVYIKNLIFEHNSETLVNDSNVSDLTYQESYLFPSEDKFVLLYPFENLESNAGLSPLFGNSLISEFAKFSNDPLLETLSSIIINEINPNVSSIIQGFIENHSDTTERKINL